MKIELTPLNYVDEAQQVINTMKKSNPKGKIYLTTSQIRNILSMINEIYNDVIHEEGNNLTEKTQERIQYLRLHIVYSAGRDRNVKNFVDQADILNQLNGIRKDKQKFLLFCKYFEALVAYHRFYGGRD